VPIAFQFDETRFVACLSSTNTSASIGWCPSVSAIFDGFSGNMLITTIATGIIKDLRISGIELTPL
jgi:hypothetical protein